MKLFHNLAGSLPLVWLVSQGFAAAAEEELVAPTTLVTSVVNSLELPQHVASSVPVLEPGAVPGMAKIATPVAKTAEPPQKVESSAPFPKPAELVKRAPSFPFWFQWRTSQRCIDCIIREWNNWGLQQYQLPYNSHVPEGQQTWSLVTFSTGDLDKVNGALSNCFYECSNRVTLSDSHGLYECRIEWQWINWILNPQNTGRGFAEPPNPTIVVPTPRQPPSTHLMIPVPAYNLFPGGSC